MLSDRELSALVAEKVMGWKLNHDIFSDRQWVGVNVEDDSAGRGE